MLPIQLTVNDLDKYPPGAKRIATSQIELLRKLPFSFVPLLLREVIAYDWKFPVERRELDSQFSYLNSLSAEQLRSSMAAFAQLRLSPEIERFDWVNSPVQFSEQFTAHLWATHQIDAFRAASVEYVHKLNASEAPEPLSIPRLAIGIVGDGVGENKYPLFRKLRPYGCYFRNVTAENGQQVLLQAVAERAAAHPVPFGHWYIDGGAENAVSYAGVTCVSYASLDSVRSALVAKMRKVMQSDGGGPEALRSMLAQMRPEELGLHGAGDQAVLNRFQVSILTEGSGTQLFSTTFVQWSAREALRRAQPLTLLTRFATRQREQSMKELLAGSQRRPVPDPEGSLVDADMGAYYTWINQQRLAGAEQAGFLVWFENHREALAVGPLFQRGTEDSSAIELAQLIRRVNRA